MKKKIAITGGIGSGKSTALNLLREEGYVGYSCDEIYKEVVLDATYVAEIKAEFPTVVENGTINRPKLSAIVFRDEQARMRLNAIAHKQIMERLHLCMEACDAPVVFAEVPLLFEGNYQDDFDAVLVFMRDDNMRIRAVCARDGLVSEEIRDRMSAQIDYNEVLKSSVGNPRIHFIYNNGDINELKSKTMDAVKQSM